MYISDMSWQTKVLKIVFGMQDFIIFILCCSQQSWSQMNESGERYERAQAIHRDQVFRKFVKRVLCCPEQVLRFVSSLSCLYTGIYMVFSFLFFMSTIFLQTVWTTPGNNYTSSFEHHAVKALNYRKKYSLDCKYSGPSLQGHYV